MANGPDHSPPPDVCLLLRAHAEARWLGHEVVPVLRELEQDALPSQQLGAAFAYLEVIWIEARGRAAETDAAAQELEAHIRGGEEAMYGRAHRYHGAVRRLRGTIARRVEPLLAAGSEAGDAFPENPLLDRPASS
jgi:hypothetical protein